MIGSFAGSGQFFDASGPPQLLLTISSNTEISLDSSNKSKV